MNLTVIALAYIEIELQHHPVRNLSEEKRDCRLRQQGSVFRKKDAEIPCHAPSATTNIRQQRNRNHRQPSSMDGQCHRPRGTYLRHRRDGLHQQRQYAAQTARPTSIRYSGLILKTATASTLISNAGRTKAAPISLTGCRKN